MNNISLHTSLAHIFFFIVPVKIKSDCAEFDNGHAIAEYNTPTPNNNEGPQQVWRDAGFGYFLW